MTLDELLKRMVGTKRGWNSPESFARTVVRLAVRRFSFPAACEAMAYVDGKWDLGIDGLAIALGAEPLQQMADVGPALEKAGGQPARLKVLFVQSKRPERIAQNDVVLFGDAVKTFLTASAADIRRLKASPTMSELHEVLGSVREARPDAFATADVSLVFGYGGIWQDFTTVNMKRESTRDMLGKEMPQARFEMEIWGAEQLIDHGLRYGPASRRKLDNVRLLELPPSVAAGYIGYVAAESLVALVSSPVPGEAGQRRADDFMFDDNVRAFLGLDQRNAERENPGAVGLNATLERGQGNHVILGHNGVVIVADAGKLADDGTSIELTGAQVVNGCQTSNVLVARSGSLDGVTVPVKIVLTEDEAVKDMIALASNTQAEVDSYDILARLPNVRALEPEFSRAAIALNERVWLQRRRNEPLDFPPGGKEDWTRVVRPRHLLDAFTASIAGRPELAHDKVQETIDLARNGIAFHPEHDPTLYRALAWMVVTGRRWARRNGRNWQDRYSYSGGQAYPARHQFIAALWHLADEHPTATGLPDIDRSRPVQERFQALIEKLVAHESAAPLGDLAGRSVDEAVPKGRRLSADLVRTRAFTEAVIARASELRATIAG